MTPMERARKGLTPEERARAVMRADYDRRGLDASWNDKFHGDITAAIRDAENEALERAAGRAEVFDKNVADAIRAMALPTCTVLARETH